MLAVSLIVHEERPATPTPAWLGNNGILDVCGEGSLGYNPGVQGRHVGCNRERWVTLRTRALMASRSSVGRCGERQYPADKWRRVQRGEWTPLRQKHGQCERRWIDQTKKSRDRRRSLAVNKSSRCNKWTTINDGDDSFTANGGNKKQRSMKAELL